MHFIEQIFGFSSDNGSGLTEFFLLLIPIVAFALNVVLRSRLMQIRKQPH
jgi:hypothetical protein